MGKGKRELTYNNLLRIAEVLVESVINVISYPNEYILQSDNDKCSAKIVLQIKIDQDKTAQVLQLVFGERYAEMKVK